jgi:hypothetical protein
MSRRTFRNLLAAFVAFLGGAAIAAALLIAGGGAL